MSPQLSLPERIKQFYEKLNTERDKALPLLDELYTSDILFISPIEVRHGLGVFRNSWRAAFKTYKVAFTDVQCVGTEDDFALFYVMTTYMGIGEPTPMRVATRCRARDGKVYLQTDYWDTLGGLTRAHQWLRDNYLRLVATYLGDGPPVESDKGLLPYIEDDGCYHPDSEEQIQGLVRKAYAEGGKIRIVGSGHSVWEAIVPGALSRDPDAKDCLLVLDRYKSISIDESSGIPLVTVDAGCYLGDSPFIPVDTRITPERSLVPTNVTTGTPFEQSLCFALQQKGYALPDLGGISHQSVGGFSTGSSGGTCTYSLLDHVHSLRVIDGQGNAVDLSPDGPNAEWFAAAGVGMGLCGILSKVTLRCEPAFNIAGKECTAPAVSHPDVDFYGPGDTERLSLAQFLSKTEYTRMMWWPQKNFDRLVVWQAARVSPGAPFEPKPYVEARIPEQIAGSMMYTILGNLDHPEKLKQHLLMNAEKSAKIRQRRARVDGTAPVAQSPSSINPSKADASFDVNKIQLALQAGAVDTSTAGRELVEMIVRAADEWVAGNMPKFDSLLPYLKPLVPFILPQLLGVIVSDNDAENPPQEFRDSWYRGLPMDNQMDDVLMPTWFTEIWIPYTEAGGEVPKAIAALRKLFAADGSDAGAYAATGPFCIELYAAGGSTRFCLNPAFGDKNVLRVDVFWFALNAGNPLDQFYPAFWRAFDEAGLEYRLHWGKFLPRPEQLARATLTARYPQWDMFTRWRSHADPKDVFLTDYWRGQLGL